MFECSALADLRGKFQTTLKWVKKQKQAVFAFGIVPSDKQSVEVENAFFDCDSTVCSAGG